MKENDSGFMPKHLYKSLRVTVFFYSIAVNLMRFPFCLSAISNFYLAAFSGRIIKSTTIERI